MTQTNVQPIAEQTEELWEQLARLREGRFFYDVAGELSRVLEGVKETGKDGAVTIKLEIKVTKGGRNPQVVLRSTIGGKRPQHDDIGKTFFVADDNTFVRAHPNQMEMYD